MRHIPTSLFIDTEVFKRNGFHLDTNAFKALRETFAKGALRLLVPEMMERELLRHYSKLAEECANKHESIQHQYPLNEIGLVETTKRTDVLNSCYNDLKAKWEDFKSHFTVEMLPLVGDLENVVDWYFKVDAPFEPGKKQKEFPDAFIISTLDGYYKEHKANIALVSCDGGFREAAKARSFIQYYSELDYYINEFKPELSIEDYKFEEPINPTIPIVREDLTELKAILRRGNNATQIEKDRALILLETRGENFKYFFLNAQAPFWLELLKAKGIFDNIAEPEDANDGNLKVPEWPPIYFLKRISNTVRSEVLDTIENLPKTSNPRVLEDIISIILEGEEQEEIIRFSTRINDFLKHGLHWGYGKASQLIKRLSFEDITMSQISENILRNTLGYLPDPKAAEKHALWIENPRNYGTTLKPFQKLDSFQINEILENGVSHLLEINPYPIAMILLDIIAQMLSLKTHDEMSLPEVNNDFSTIWCKRVDEDIDKYGEENLNLIIYLTKACEKVFEQQSESIVSLNQALCSHRWDLLKRIRQHLYAKHPTNETLPWIREFILLKNDYNSTSHTYESQRMIRSACEQFREKILPREELQGIFNSILCGPPKEEFQEFMGDDFTEDAYTKRQNYFQYQQLSPFKSVLFGEYAVRFNQIYSAAPIKISDESYAPYKSAGAKFIQNRSPKPVSELSKLSDKDLLQFINSWNSPKRDNDSWWIEENFSALADSFKEVIKSSILPNNDRLHWWFENKEDIKRPIYVEEMLTVFTENIKEGALDNLAEFLDFSYWIVTHPDKPNEDGIENSNRSANYSDWSTSRRMVLYLIDSCTSTSVNAPIEFKETISTILEKLCLDYDQELDQTEDDILDRDDQFSDAINRTRSRALESLVQFGFWVKRHIENDTQEEISHILDERIVSSFPITHPEYSMLGMQFGNICYLIPDWAKLHKEVIFPVDKLNAWREAFRGFLRYNQPHKPVFDLLKEDYNTAILNIDLISSPKQSDDNLINRLGNHVFTFYLWEVYNIGDENSLLDKFYASTETDKTIWGNLLQNMGSSFKKSKHDLDPNLVQRAIDFIGWRLTQKAPKELESFSSWIEAECFDEEWRLNTFSKALDILVEANAKIDLHLSTLESFLDSQLALVMECFVKLTSVPLKGNFIFFHGGSAKKILKAGLASTEKDVRKNADQAQENLLRNDRFDFLDDL